MDASNEHLASVDGVLYNAGKTALLMYPMAKEDSTLELPDTVIGVYENAFTGPAVQNITKVVIPKSFGSGSLSDADFMQLFMNLEEISVSQENVWFSSDDGVLFDKDKKILVISS